ncbi:hypothetical protein GGR51DRAFT_478511 [Nemania sp. FL0031]|nr:hypothetical protein GGR51DRAFT_478511 [Nemania sp. FL0031]
MWLCLLTSSRSLSRPPQQVSVLAASWQLALAVNGCPLSYKMLPIAWCRKAGLPYHLIGVSRSETQLRRRYCSELG